MSRNIKAGDIFIAKTLDYKQEQRNHYFYCVYSQEQDRNNGLCDDFLGLMITSNEKIGKIIDNDMNDYNVKINIHDKDAYVCCDKIFRFDKDKIIFTNDIYVSKYERKIILRYYKRFLGETLRQLDKR